MAVIKWRAHTHLNRGLSPLFDTPLCNYTCTFLCECLECMCPCKCAILSCLSIVVITFNPMDDTFNPLCQPSPLQQHSGKDLGLALVHSSVITHAHTHKHAHTYLSGNTKAGRKEKKAFLLGKKSKLSHICICVRM